MAEHNLWEKCKNGRLEEVSEALEGGADPNTTGGPCNSTTSCLMEAALNNHNRVVALLLSSEGINVNAKSKSGWTALHWACGNESLASLSKLLAAPGVQLNKKNDNSDTPIMMAIRWGRTEAVLQMAAVREVDLDVKDNQGRSLQEFANWAGEAAPAIVQILEEAMQRRRLVREQKAKVLKVLLDGLHDPESSLNMLRCPNDVRSPVMEKIWDLVTGDWQVFNEGGSAGEAP